MCCTIWYHLHILKIVKNTHGGVLLLVKVTLLHGCFSRFLNVQMVLNRATHHILEYWKSQIQAKTQPRVHSPLHK